MSRQNKRTAKKGQKRDIIEIEEEDIVYYREESHDEEFSLDPKICEKITELANNNFDWIGQGNVCYNDLEWNIDSIPESTTPSSGQSSPQRKETETKKESKSKKKKNDPIKKPKLKDLLIATHYQDLESLTNLSNELNEHIEMSMRGEYKDMNIQDLIAKKEACDQMYRIRIEVVGNKISIPRDKSFFESPEEKDACIKWAYKQTYGLAITDSDWRAAQEIFRAGKTAATEGTMKEVISVLKAFKNMVLDVLEGVKLAAESISQPLKIFQKSSSSVISKIEAIPLLSQDTRKKKEVTSINTHPMVVSGLISLEKASEFYLSLTEDKKARFLKARNKSDLKKIIMGK